MYQLISILYELFLFFISSFLSFHLHIKMIILFFVYSDDHQHSFVYPSLEEDDLHFSSIVDIDHFSPSQPIEKDEVHISIPPEIEQPYSHGNHEDDLPSKVFVLPCNQLVKPCFQPTVVQTRIKEKMFKPLRLPSHLHPYPLNFFEYLPHFSGEDHITAEKHLRAFENFVYRFEIVHEYVTMRLFSKSLCGEAAFWFKGLGDDSISSWTELYYAFSKYWGENKSFDQYLADFHVLRRKEDEALAIFNMMFCSFYHSMPLEIQPYETATMVYYISAQHPYLVLLLRERKYSSLRWLFEDAEEVEENIRSCKRIQDQTYFEDIHSHERQGECKYDSYLGQFFLVFSYFSMDRDIDHTGVHFFNQFEHVVKDDCIDNYIFLADHNHNFLAPTIQLSCDHYSEEETVTLDDQ
jgi:hypothetical protein